MSRTIVAVTTAYNGNKRYVTSTIPRINGQKAVELFEDPSKAHDFLTMHHAQDLLPKIFNPFERIYQAETITVTQPPAFDVKTQSWLEEKVLK